MDIKSKIILHYVGSGLSGAFSLQHPAPVRKSLLQTENTQVNEEDGEVQEAKLGDMIASIPDSEPVVVTEETSTLSKPHRKGTPWDVARHEAERRRQAKRKRAHRVRKREETKEKTQNAGIPKPLRNKPKRNQRKRRGSDSSFDGWDM
jgi:hypothetical protein